MVNSFKQYPDLMSGVKSGFGLGCYSATPAENEWWHKSFPGLQLLGGFDAGAPSAQQPTNQAFITDVLTKDAALRKVGEDKSTEHNLHMISQMIHGIKGFDVMNTAVCTKDIYVGKNSGAFDITKPNKLCTQKELDGLKKVQPRAEALIASDTDTLPTYRRPAMRYAGLVASQLLHFTSRSSALHRRNGEIKY